MLLLSMLFPQPATYNAPAAEWGLNPGADFFGPRPGAATLAIRRRSAICDILSAGPF
jgi:hypothetical protein